VKGKRKNRQVQTDSCQRYKHWTNNAYECLITAVKNSGVKNTAVSISTVKITIAIITTAKITIAKVTTVVIASVKITIL
jgi:hypothetical protein